MNTNHIIGRAARTAKSRAAGLFHNATARLVAVAVTRLVFGVLAARAVVFGDYAPFGMAYAAAGVATGGITSVAAACGVVIGYISAFDLTDGIKYLAGTALALTAVLAFKGTRLSRRVYFAPCATALAMAAVGFVYAVGRGSAESAALFFCEVVLSFAFTYFTALARRYGAKDASPFCMLIFAAVLLLGAQDIVLVAGISAAKLVAALAVLLAARYGGVGAGAACGVTFGIVFDIGGGDGFYCMTYGIGGLAAGALRGGARIYAASAYVLISGTLALTLGTRGLYETFAATVIYMLLPEKLPLRAFFAALGGGAAALQESDVPPPRLVALAEAYGALAGLLNATAPPLPDRDAVYTRAARRTCTTCPRVTQCWQSGYALAELRGLGDTLSRNARLRTADLGAAFARVCNRADDLCDSVTEEYRVGQLERRAALREAQDRARLAGQYSLTARVLHLAHKPPNKTAAPASQRSPTVGAHSRRRQGSSASGDRGTWFKTPYGEMVVMLSDGMGSGEEAAAQSAELLGLAEKLIRAGVPLCDMVTALETVLSARGGAAFATLDVLLIEASGRAEMVKCGAAPSYVRFRGGEETQVVRMDAAGLPPGTNIGVAPASCEIDCNVADMVVMLTDGVCDGGDDAWLVALIEAHSGDPGSLARKITAASSTDDDASALVIAL